MNNRLNIQDLAGLLSEYTGKDKAEVEQFLKCLVAVVSEGVYTDKLVKIKGLGTFKIITVDKRESIHVNTGERFLIPAHYKFSFLPDKDLKELVNKPFSVFETTEILEDVNFSDMEESVEVSEKEKEVDDESVEEVMPEEKVVAAKTDLVPKEELIPEVAVKETEEEPVPEEAMPKTEEEPVPEGALSETEEKPVEKMAEPEPTTATASEERMIEKPTENPVDIKNEVVPAATPLIVPKTDVKTTPANKRSVLLWVVLAFMLILVAIGCFTIGRYYCFPDPVIVEMEPKVVSSDPQSLPDTMAKSEEQKQVVDSVFEHPDKPNRDSVLAKKPLTDPMPPKPLDTIQIKRGDRLTVIALKYYGNKLFWVYLYKHNRAVIADPNNVPIGTSIEIPIPAMYGIDAKSSASRAKAAALQTEILSGNK